MRRMAAIIAASAALTCAGSALAQDACVRPTAPTVADGAKATMDELMASKKAVTEFMTASDAYQTCVIDGLAAKRAAAKAAKTKVDPAVVKAADADVSANQTDKESVGRAFNKAAKAYKAAHPS